MRTNTTMRATLLALSIGLLLVGVASAQEERPASPKGHAATQIGDDWIDVEYSRPILRGRQDIFGTGDDYGSKVNAGAPVWRAGANVTTRLKTELDLEIGGTKVPAGEYSFFIELKDGAWTGIISKQEYMESPDRKKMGEGITWGAYGYDSEHDVVRAQMTVLPNDVSVDQLTIVFTEVSDAGGSLTVVWDKTIGVLPFKVLK